MKLPGKSFDEEKNPTVTLDKQKAVGGDSYNMFDSGCNLSGLRKVHMYWDYNTKSTCHSGSRSTIKRIFLEFDKPSRSNDRREPSYNNGIAMSKISDDTLSIVEVNTNDPIVRIDVWTNGSIVNGIQFFMRSGAISQLYGMTVNPNNPATTFEGKGPCSELVGVHGCCGEAVGGINKLGFTFATFKNKNLGFPPNHIDASWATTLDDIESLVTASKEEEEVVVVVAS